MKKQVIEQYVVGAGNIQELIQQKIETGHRVVSMVATKVERKTNLIVSPLITTGLRDAVLVVYECEV